MVYRRIRRLWPALLLLLVGCASHPHRMAVVSQQLAAGQPQAALKVLTAQEPPQRDQVLYWMESATLKFSAGDHRGSLADLEQAKALGRELSSVSISEQTAAFTLNEQFVSFVGAPFERFQIHVWAIFNYLALGDLAGARVEALQIDELSRTLASEEEEAVLIADPFARYLAGLVFAANGDWNDAYIAFLHAYNGYLAHNDYYDIEVPDSLRQDLLLAAEHAGLDMELARWSSEWAMLPPSSGDGKEVVAILMQGYVPRKSSTHAMHASPKGVLVNIALPVYRQPPMPSRPAALRIGGESVAISPVADLDALSRATLSQRMPALIARSVARMIAKVQISRAIKDESGRSGGGAATLIGLLTEQADTRSWNTLPQSIYLARVSGVDTPISLHVNGESLSLEGEQTWHWLIRRYWP